VGADETFFNDMILVFMDLASGYIFFEEEALRVTGGIKWCERKRTPLYAVRVDAIVIFFP